MTPGEILSLMMIIALCGFTLVGFPISFTLVGVSLITAGIGTALGIFDTSFLGFVPNRMFGVMTNEVLIAIPLFVFMGVMLERSKVAEELLDTDPGRVPVEIDDPGIRCAGRAAGPVVGGALARVTPWHGDETRSP